MKKCECSRSFTWQAHRVPTPRERVLAGPADHRNRARRNASTELKRNEHPLVAVEVSA